jgi:mitochondrial fission protein ELM1
LPDPQLIISTGRRTHLTNLAARRARGGRSIVLMRPSLPRSWFDLCIVPAHDRLQPDSHTLPSLGPLNPVKPASPRVSESTSLCLIGGPSKHYRWDQDGLIDQLKTLIAATPLQPFVIADSRRTPEATSRALQRLAGKQLKFFHHLDTPVNWIDQQLAQAAWIWVTRDSLAMVYESLSSGAAVGLIDVPVRRRSPLTRAVDHLLADRQVVSFADWCGAGAAPLLPPAPLQEARRCAAIISQRWFAELTMNRSKTVA